MNANANTMKRSLWLMAAAAAGAAWLLCPNKASAGQFGLTMVKRDAPVWVPPVYQTKRRLVTLPAVCETRPRRVWNEPIYDVRRVLVDLPAKVRTQRVARRGPYGRTIGFRTVTRVIQPATRVWRTKRVLVRAGFYETVYDRVCTRAETTKVVFEKVLVRKGRWMRPGFRTVDHGPRPHWLVRKNHRHEPRDHAWRLAVDVGW